MKKIFIISLILILFFTCVSVSAADANDTIVTSDNFTPIQNSPDLYSEGSEFLEQANNGTFRNLANEILIADNELNLTRNYVYDVERDKDYYPGIEINKKICINGNGFIIDGNNIANSFKINYPGVTLKNITFINFCPYLFKNYGGVISWNSDLGVLSDCNFINCRVGVYNDDEAYSYGGVIYWNGDDGLLENCNFMNIKNYVQSTTSDAFSYGEAVYWKGDYGNLINSTFINCSGEAYISFPKSYRYAHSTGGAVCWKGEYGNLKNCCFKNNRVNRGGAVAWLSSNNGSISNCSFVNCSTINDDINDWGGAVDISGCQDLIISNCYFVNNTSYEGGAVYKSGPDLFISNCYFVNNTSHNGGAIYSIGDGHVLNSSFINNTASFMGDAIVADGEHYFYILNCKFNDLSQITFFNYVNLTLLNNKIGVIMEIYSPRDGEVIIRLIDFNNKVLSNVPGEYSINNNKNSFITNENGEFKLTNLKGKTLIDAKYLGDEIFSDAYKSSYFNFTGPSNDNNAAPDNNPSGNDSNISISKVLTYIVALPVSCSYNGGTSLSIMLIDNQGNFVPNVLISVNLNNDKKYKTDKNGQIKVPTKGLAPRTYTANITFNGNAKYNPATKSVKVTVKKATPKLTVKAKTFKKSLKTKKYTVTLKTNQNKVMKNTKVSIKVNKKTYTATTNNKGQATFKITKLNKKGTFKSVITYKGDKYYSKVTKQINIKVK